MDLSLKTESIAQDDQRWLGSAAGTTTGRPAVLDFALFTAATHYPDGYFRSGTPLGRVTATGRFGPYTAGATNGTQTLAGFLLTPTRANPAANVVGALLDGTGQPRIVTAFLPIAVDSTAQATNTKFVYV